MLYLITSLFYLLFVSKLISIFANYTASSDISSDLNYRAYDARDGSSSYSNRRDQSSLEACCTDMWTANEKATILLLSP